MDGQGRIKDKIKVKIHEHIKKQINWEEAEYG